MNFKFNYTYYTVAHKCNKRQLFAIPASYKNNIAQAKPEGRGAHAVLFPEVPAGMLSKQPTKQSLGFLLEHRASTAVLNCTCFVSLFGLFLYGFVGFCLFA